MKWSFLLLSIWTQCVLADVVISKTAFTDKYIAVALEKVEGLKATKSGELEVKFEGENGARSTTFLNNAYVAYTNEPEFLDQIIDHFTDSLAEGFHQLDSKLVVTDHILPVIKGKEYISQISAMMKERGADQFPFYYEKLNNELFVLYVIDTPTSMNFVSESILTENGIDKKALRKIAKTNLRDATKLQTQGISDTVSMLVADGIYEASFILFDSIWNETVFPVKGRIVIHLLARDVVLVTGSEEAEGLEKVKSLIHDPNNEWPNMISPKAFVHSEQGWEVFEDK